MPANNCSSAEGPVALSTTGHPPPLLSALLLALSSALLALAIASCASSQASDSIDIVQAAFDRFAQGDVDGYLEYFAEDAVFVQADRPPYGRDTARELMSRRYADGYRLEIREAASEGNVVTYTLEVFEGEVRRARFPNAVAVVTGNKIAFWSPYESYLLSECERDPSQAFCIGD